MSNPTPKSAELVVLELRAKLASCEAEVAKLRGLLVHLDMTLDHVFESLYEPVEPPTSTLLRFELEDALKRIRAALKESL